MHIPSLIEKKRDGGTLSSEEVAAIVGGYTRGDIPDYQMSAFAMAVYFKGMTPGETATLTRCMMESGSVFAYPSDAPERADKHSTGGVGDKVSLILAPLLACDGFWVPMVSGRGLGITGGTLDKLESIPGFRVGLDMDAALAQLGKIGVVMMGQTADFCPADRKLYALRDVTGTVPSQALIVASIMSKKLAESLDRLVLDVKFGSGAFMKKQSDAVELADAMRAVGEAMGVRMETLLTPMDEPLGHAVGNALEVEEAVACLQGRGPADLENLVLDLTAPISHSSREELKRLLDSGAAWELFVRMTESQGGTASDLGRIAEIHRAPLIIPFSAPASGTLTRMDAGLIGRASVQLGAGRSQASDPVDFAVGFSRILKRGSLVSKGDPLLHIHARSDSAAESILPMLEAAVSIEDL